MKIFRRAVIGTAAVWAGKKLLARRRSGNASDRSKRQDQPVETGGDGFQTEPPAVRE